MPLKITHRKEQEVPTPTALGKVNQDLEALKAEMFKLRQGMVLEVQTGAGRSVRGIKMLITRAGNQIGTSFRHWHEGTRVFAKPKGVVRRRRRKVVAAGRRRSPAKRG